jgi:hypothetical protein
MMNFNRRNFADRLMLAFSALGIGSAVLGKSAFGQTRIQKSKSSTTKASPPTARR